MVWLLSSERTGHILSATVQAVEVGNFMSKKVFDCFLYNGEWKLLLLRLNEMFEVVDEFVVVEANMSFSGVPKKFHLMDLGSQISPFLSKITYLQISEDLGASDAWEREAYHRNFASDYLKSQEGLIILSDVDEIIYAETVNQIKSDKISQSFSFHLTMNYFAFDFQNYEGVEKDCVWNCAFDSSYLATYELQELRDSIRHGTISSTAIRNAGCHLSYFMDREGVQQKVKEFSHQELNTISFHEKLNIPHLVANSLDLYSRENYLWRIDQPKTKFKFVDANPDLYKSYFSSNILKLEIERQSMEIERQSMEIERQYRMFVDSLSWRLVAPLRFAARVFRWRG